jgi:hypothetical protein
MIENKEVYSWDSKIEKAFFGGAPTSMKINSFPSLGLPIDSSYKSVV